MPKFTSQEVALAYMQANGAGLKEEEFLVQLIEKEQEFSKLLEIDNLKEHLANEQIEIFAKLAR
ncbi:hypothetical protein K3G69_21750 [Phytobacter diazotrophicus]|uniref:hypothetical protein n=1 Tax=Phytobacter diazotrophicus TaxID=395631 RepID=UPI001C9A0D5B|nr:hypothetical protein [Phytobacter diazotrophicus]MBY6259122.1 hypothetical protein [Phytobacter diazotrophicus]